MRQLYTLYILNLLTVKVTALRTISYMYMYIDTLIHVHKVRDFIGCPGIPQVFTLYMHVHVHVG